MFYSYTNMAILGFATFSNAHMIMTTPVPYGKSSLTNAPLLDTGSDFPCKQRTGVYDLEGASNVFALGSTQPLAFEGSATHGGGSCQISITYDEEPTADSIFKVIHSIEGGCPVMNTAGNLVGPSTLVDPDTYNFTIPTDIPSGNATIAWTWFNKIGNREMYMNCAPVTLTTTSSKRSEELEERDTSAYDALPDMFVANVGNGCGTVEPYDLIFFNPGDSVDKLGGSTASATHTATGTGCVTAAGASGSGSSATSVASSAASATISAAASTSSDGFATSAASASSVVASTVASSGATPTVTGSSSGNGTSSTGSGSAITAGTACTDEGEWNCIGGTSYQQCASGIWSVVQALADGTACTPGQSAAIDIFASSSKRTVRFPRDHIRRHAHSK